MDMTEPSIWRLRKGPNEILQNPLQLLRVADGIVQQGHLRVRKLEKLLDGGNVHRHARAGHQAHAGTEQINILAHDSRVGPHRHLCAGVAASELGLVCNDEDADRGRLRPILTVGNERPVVTLRHLFQGVFLVQVFRDALAREHEHADFLEVAGSRRSELAVGRAVHADSRKKQIRKILVTEHLVAELRAGSPVPKRLHDRLAAGLCRSGELLKLRHGKRTADERCHKRECKTIFHGVLLVRGGRKKSRINFTRQAIPNAKSVY